MKKRIIIISHAMELGGAEKSLLGLLSTIDTERYDVDLFLLRHEGELMPFIPKNIHLLPEKPAYTVLARPMKDTLSEGHFMLTFARLVGKVFARIYEKKHKLTDSGVALDLSHKFTCPFMPDIEPAVEYDLAISFLCPHYFGLKKIKAKKRIAFIHTDYSKVQVDVESEEKIWGGYDHIASISPSVTDTFVGTFPSLASKIILIENILPKALIEQQKLAFDASSEMPHKGIRLLSIGRFCTAKNFDNIPEICRMLTDMGLDVYWYIIGYGPDEQIIRNKIAEFEVKDRVVILGKKDNPYPYIDRCDLYVQPSRYEGKCVTVREAQMLLKPVVITDYATSASQLENGVDGMIVPMKNSLCAIAIAELLCDPDKLKSLSLNCRNADYSNAEEIRKIYEIIDR